MKSMYLRLMLLMACVTINNISAMSFYNLLEQRLVDCGQLIEATDNLPVIDKLTNVLPCAVVAACLKKCPGQTMVALAGLCMYIVYQNGLVQQVVRKCNPFRSYRSGHNNNLLFDETLFVFDGEDEDDAQDEEDELLAEDKVYFLNERVEKN